MIWLGYVWASWPQCSVMGTDTESKFIGDSNRSQFGELSKSALQIWLPSDSWRTPDWLPTNFGQAQIKQKIFFGDDTRSQFGELSKSALQIWRAFQMNSPNLVTIRLLTDCWLTPDWLLTYSWLTLVIATGHNLESYPNQFSKFGYHQTPDWLLTYSWLTPIILWTDLLKQQRFVGDDTRSQFGELSKSALQIWRAVQTSSPNLVIIRLLSDVGFNVSLFEVIQE